MKQGCLSYCTSALKWLLVRNTKFFGWKKRQLRGDIIKSEKWKGIDYSIRDHQMKLVEARFKSKSWFFTFSCFLSTSGCAQKRSKQIRWLEILSAANWIWLYRGFKGNLPAQEGKAVQRKNEGCERMEFSLTWGGILAQCLEILQAKGQGKKCSSLCCTVQPAIGVLFRTMTS